MGFSFFHTVSASVTSNTVWWLSKAVIILVCLFFLHIPCNVCSTRLTLPQITIDQNIFHYSTAGLVVIEMWLLNINDLVLGSESVRSLQTHAIYC